MRKAITIALAVALCVPMLASGYDLSKHIAYTGFLTEGGNPVTGEKTIIFRIYTEPSDDDTAPNPPYDDDRTNALVMVWTETHTVQVTDGEFSVNLGSGGSSLDAIDFSGNKQYWLAIKVGALGAELYPRKQILFVPYALRSNTTITIQTWPGPGDPPNLVDGQIWLRTDL